jgi:hypothetical protein
VLAQPRSEHKCSGRHLLTEHRILALSGYATSGFDTSGPGSPAGAPLALSEGMWYSPEHLVAFSSLLLLAPTTLPHTDASAPARVSVCDAPTFGLPPSVVLADGLEPIVRWALEYSPTFRQQCRALAAQPGLTATVRVTARPPGTDTRARAVFRQKASGDLVADIEIRSSTELLELLGHEFEHLIEKLDGVDLLALVRRGEARRLPDGAFETTRAIRAGQRVSREVVDNAPDLMRRTTGSLWRALRRVVGLTAQDSELRQELQRPVVRLRSEGSLPQP